jgi:hypothetical protein
MQMVNPRKEEIISTPGNSIHYTQKRTAKKTESKIH